MASIEESQNPETGEPDVAVDGFQRLVKQSRFHFVIAVLGIPIMIGIFMAGLIGLEKLHKSTSALLTEKPESYAESYKKKIAAVQTRAAAQYQNYFDKMESSNILADSSKLTGLFSVSVEAENDYVVFLDTYKQLNYELASRVKGSGEWYFYFNQSLEESIEKAKKRQAEMSEQFF